MSSNRIKGQKIQVGESFVLPIEQTKVTRQEAKVQKIIQETDAKAKTIIDNAETQSKVVVQAANTEAENIITQSRKRAEDEYESIKSQAYEDGLKKGREDGLLQFQNEIGEAMQSLDVLTQSSYEIKKNIIDSATHDIVELVAAIADKVCQVRFDDEILHKITLEAIKQLDDKENITLIVSPQLVKNISDISSSFKEEIPKLKTIKIIEDDSLSPDGVIVETPKTRLDSRVSSQIGEIAERMLKDSDG